MTAAESKIGRTKYDIDTCQVTLSQLVGFQLELFSDQFPAKVLLCKVAAVIGQEVFLEAGQRYDHLANLVNHQSLIVRFPYRGQNVCVRARLKKTGGGSCHLILADSVTPLSQRRFHRLRITAPVNLAPLSSVGFRADRIKNLRWLRTDLLDISSGGALLALPTVLDKAARLLVHLDLEEHGFPPLVIAQVRHAYCTADQQPRVGVEFMTMEATRKTYSPAHLQEMPPALLAYTNTKREQLNRRLVDRDATVEELT